MRSHRATLMLTAVPLLLLGAGCSTDDDSDGSSATDGGTVDSVAVDDSVTVDDSVLSGETLTVETTGSTVTVDGAVVTPPADEAVSGEEGEEIVVFRIDRVLLPS